MAYQAPHRVFSYPHCLVPGRIYCHILPSSLGIQGNPAFATNLKPGSHHSVPTGQRGLCPEGLQPQGPANPGAGIIYRAGEAQSRHCLKPTRDSVPSY